jgi:hypothetical protein
MSSASGRLATLRRSRILTALTGWRAAQPGGTCVLGLSDGYVELVLNPSEHPRVRLSVQWTSGLRADGGLARFPAVAEPALV